MYRRIILSFTSLCTLAMNGMDKAIYITAPGAASLVVNDNTSIQQLSQPLLPSQQHDTASIASVTLDNEQEIVAMQGQATQEEWPCGCAERSFLIGSCICVFSFAVGVFALIKCLHLN